jgi:hypothetical protein
MRWLKRVISLALLIAAGAVALTTGLSDHKNDFGQVPIPQGGMVHLPQGKVVVYYDQPGDGADPIRQVSGPLAFQVVSASGVAVPVSSVDGAPAGVAVQRSETIGELGAVGKLDVPAPGNYTVQTSSADAVPAYASLEFGTNAGAAVFAKWKLLAGLLVGAFLVALIPVPKPHKHWGDEAEPPTGWSSDPRAPYAG